MIDFELPRYEWQKNMDLVLENVNLHDVRLSNDDHGLQLGFLNSYNGKHCGSIQCRNIWKIQFEADNLMVFPIFCDVRLQKISKEEIVSAFKIFKHWFEIPENTNYYMLCIDMGDVIFTLFCGYVKVIKVE